MDKIVKEQTGLEILNKLGIKETFLLKCWQRKYGEKLIINNVLVFEIRQKAILYMNKVNDRIINFYAKNHNCSMTNIVTQLQDKDISIIAIIIAKRSDSLPINHSTTLQTIARRGDPLRAVCKEKSIFILLYFWPKI